MILTIEEIKDLAGFVGLVINSRMSVGEDQMETEISIEDCPKKGILNESENKIKHYKHIARYDEINDGEVMPLGEEIIV